MITKESTQEEVEHSVILDMKYKVQKTIGEGRYAKVKMALDMETKKSVAIKIMRECNTDQQIEHFLNECRIISLIDCQNSVKLLSVSLNGQYIKADGRMKKVAYYVMKIAAYGELFNIVDATPNFPENLARYYFKQLLQGMEALHDKKIAHRDIKTENILIDAKYCLKICDFGFATKFIDSDGRFKQFDSTEVVGSLEYNPPEISNPDYFGGVYNGEQMDLYQIAIVLFTMVMKSQPFNSTHRTDPYYQRLIKNKNQFWKIYSGNCQPSVEFKDLIEKMLQETPEKRLKMNEIKAHPWVLGETLSVEEVQGQMRGRGQQMIELQRNKPLKKTENVKNSKHSTKYGHIVALQDEEIISKYQNDIAQINRRIFETKERRKQKKIDMKQLKEQQQSLQKLEEKFAQPKYTQQAKIIDNLSDVEQSTPQKPKKSNAKNLRRIRSKDDLFMTQKFLWNDSTSTTNTIQQIQQLQNAFQVLFNPQTTQIQQQQQAEQQQLVNNQVTTTTTLQVQTTQQIQVQQGRPQRLRQCKSDSEK